MIYNIHYIRTVNCTFPHLPAKFSPHVHPGNPFGLVFPARGISAERNESSHLLTAVQTEQRSGEKQDLSQRVTTFQRALEEITVSVCQGCKAC